MKSVSRNTELTCQYITFCLLTFLLLLGSFGCNLASRADRQAREDLYANYDEEFKRLLSSANRQMSRDVLQYEPIAADLLPKRIIGSVRLWFPVEVNHLLIADSKGQAAVVEFDVDRNMVAFRRKEPYLVLTNTAYQEGIDFVKEHCGRYRKGVSMCKSGIRATDDMLKVMKAMQLKSGNNRTLWTSIADLSKRRMDVRFRSENYSVSHIFELIP